jgi:hypothetical protein
MMHAFATNVQSNWLSTTLLYNKYSDNTLWRMDSIATWKICFKMERYAVFMVNVSLIDAPDMPIIDQSQSSIKCACQHFVIACLLRHTLCVVNELRRHYEIQVWIDMSTCVDFEMQLERFCLRAIFSNVQHHIYGRMLSWFGCHPRITWESTMFCFRMGQQLIIKWYSQLYYNAYHLHFVSNVFGTTLTNRLVSYNIRLQLPGDYSTSEHL